MPIARSTPYSRRPWSWVVDQGVDGVDDERYAGLQQPGQLVDDALSAPGRQQHDGVVLLQRVQDRLALERAEIPFSEDVPKEQRQRRARVSVRFGHRRAAVPVVGLSSRHRRRDRRGTDDEVGFSGSVEGVERA